MALLGLWAKGLRGARTWVKGKGVKAAAMNRNVVSLQINTAAIMAMNRMERIVLVPIRTYTCTRTARMGVRVTTPSLSKGMY